MKQNCNKYCGWCKKKEKKEEESKEEKEEKEEKEKDNEKKEEDEEEENEKEEEKEEDKENEEDEDYDETCKDKTASCRYWKQQYCSKTSRSVFIVLVQVYAVPTSVESRGSFATIFSLI